MSTLIPIKYHKKAYPYGIAPTIEEIAGNLDKTPKDINPKLKNYSLHTEFSFTKRNKLNSEFIKKFKTISNSHNNFIPQLWTSKKWSEEFVKFIKELVGKNKSPKIIEIHPPFNDYCKSIEEFIERYEVFERGISETYKTQEQEETPYVETTNDADTLPTTEPTQIQIPPGNNQPITGDVVSEKRNNTNNLLLSSLIIGLAIIIGFAILAFVLKKR